MTRSRVPKRLEQLRKQFCRCEATDRINAEIRAISRLSRLYPVDKFSGFFLDSFGQIKAIEYVKTDDKHEVVTVCNNTTAN